eukprot:TRINITY_DN28370_c0_g1_i1.p1 TRINITY_DN28370_c0_g1~~TRINITY_DN28370_c0_g1_i1.p1  ORF type:complete len:411 (+),score=49.98 TRINITY_DN28370_c0_g1_i1:62-1294(+)
MAHSGRILTLLLLGTVRARLLPVSFRMPQVPPAQKPCPCANTSLCQTPTVQHNREFFGFGASNWKTFDWTQITTVCWAQDPELICKAHETGARVIAAAPQFDLSILGDRANRSVWINNLLSIMKNGFYDGITFDYESPLDKSQGSSTYDLQRNYVSLVSETTDAVHSAIPGSQISVCVAWSPDDIDGRNYDFAALARASDMLYMMVYDTQSQIYGKCIASANSPLSIADRAITRYLQIGIPREKLILGTPWYGYHYACQNSGPSDDVCELKLVPFRGVNCSDAAGSELAFRDIMNLFDRDVCPPGSNAVRCRVTSGLRWDESTQSPYFNYVVDDSQLWQVWFDNAQSSSLKFALAGQRGVRGVGPFTWDDLDNDGSITGNPKASSEAKEMWDSLKSFKTDGTTSQPAYQI